MPSHHNLHTVFWKAWNQGVLPRGSFPEMVFRLVLFHQSLAMLDRQSPMMELSDEESNAYCEPAFLKLYGVLVIADTTAYNLFDAKKTQMKRAEILANIDRLTRQWKLDKE